MPKSRPTPAELHNMYWAQGMTQAEVASELGCTEKTARKWLHEAGVGARQEGFARGKDNPSAKINQGIADTMKRRYYSDIDATQQALAEEYGVSVSNVHHVVTRKTWTRSKIKRSSWDGE